MVKHAAWVSGTLTAVDSIAGDDRVAIVRNGMTMAATRDVFSGTFASVSALENYAGSQIPVGSVVRTVAEGYAYRVVSSDASGRYLETAGGTRLDRIITETGGFEPLRNATLEALVSSVRVIASRLRDGYVYGRSGSDLYRSANAGTSWELVESSLGACGLLAPAGDGEVLAACAGAGVKKSSGWASDPLTATWSVVLSSDDGDFLAWGLDTDGRGICVATHYRASDYTKSRYVWRSADAGDGWSIIRDLDAVNSGESSPDQYHLHFAALDPWADNRIWISWHGDSGEGETGKRIEFSDDDGDTWSTLTSAWQPTTAVATPNGMVFGTDDGPGGILHCEHRDDPDDMAIYLAAPFPVEQTGVAWVFAVYAEYDEISGVAYTSFISQVDGTPGGIFASDGRSCSEIYRTDPQSNGDGIREFAFAGDEILWFADLGTSYTLRTTKARRGPSKFYEADTGRVLGGRIVDEGSGTPYKSTAMGAMSVAGPGANALAIGTAAEATHSGAVVFQGDASAANNEFRIPPNRHVFLPTRSGTPGAPTGGAVLYLLDNGGTFELRIRFANGTVKTITDDTA